MRAKIVVKQRFFVNTPFVEQVPFLLIFRGQLYVTSYKFYATRHPIAQNMA